MYIYKVQQMQTNQGIGIKGREMVQVWHEKASGTALQTSSLLLTHTLLIQTHNMTTVKEISEKCRLRCKIRLKNECRILFQKSKTIVEVVCLIGH